MRNHMLKNALVFILILICSPSYYCYAQGEEVRDYSLHIARLPHKLDSILIARDELFQRFPVQSSQDFDDALRAFISFYKNKISTEDSNFYRDRKLQSVLHKLPFVNLYTIKPLETFLNNKTTTAQEFQKQNKDSLVILLNYRKCGVDFYSAEGDWYLKEDPDFIVNIASHYKSPLSEYLIFNAEENRQLLGEDAGLYISWEELRKRIVRWDSFALAHPLLKETEENVFPQIRKLLFLYLIGPDNTRGFSRETNELLPQLKTSYENFLSENKSSICYQIIKKSYNILKAHQFKDNDEYRRFLRSEGVIR